MVATPNVSSTSSSGQRTGTGWLRLRRPGRTDWLALAAASTVLTALLASDDGPVLCPYRRCTGGDCPLCGVTRSAGRLMRGDVAGSWRVHPMVVLVALQLPLIAVLTVSGRRARVRQLALANLVLAALVWAGRLATGEAAAPSALMWPW